MDDKRRATLTVDLGELRASAEVAAARDGVRLSQWVRQAVGTALGASGDLGAASPSRGLEVPLSATTLGEAEDGRRASVELDASSAARLDALAERGGFRSRVAALRALLAGAGPMAGGDASLSEALAALRISNVRLANLELDLKANARAGVAAGSDSLERAIRAAHTHVEVASQVVAGLSPILKSGKEAS